MFIPLLKVGVAIGFDTDTKEFVAQADEQIGPLPDAQQTLKIDPLKAIGLLSGGLRKDVVGLLGPHTAG